MLRSKLGPWPVWVWLLIMTAAAAGVYFLWSNKSGSSGTGQAAAQTDTSGAPEVVIQNQTGPYPSGTGTTPPAAPGESRKTEFVEGQTGSEHPWTFLKQHHEHIEGQPGHYRIVPDKSKSRVKRAKKGKHPKKPRNTTNSTNTTPAHAAHSRHLGTTLEPTPGDVASTPADVPLSQYGAAPVPAGPTGGMDTGNPGGDVF